MKKEFLALVVATAGVISVNAGYLHPTPRCIVCNSNKLDDMGMIDPVKDQNRYYKVGIGAPKEAKTGYYCDPESKPQCEKKVLEWTNVTIQKTKSIVLDLHAKGQKNKEQKKIVQKTAADLKKFFIAAAIKKLPVKQQISVMNKLVSKCNAVDFWSALVQGASMDVVKYYWPEPKNEKIRNLAAQVIARRNKKQSQADRRESQQLFNTLFTATANPRSGEPAKQMMGMFMPQGVDIAPKTTITPFAIGRSKKDNEIIFTDSRWFSETLIKAAAVANRHDVLAYFAKQCGSFTEEINLLAYTALVESYGEKEKTIFHAKLELKNLNEQLQKCDTEFEKKKINTSIASFNYIIRKNNYKVSTAVTELLLADSSMLKMRSCIAKVMKELSSEFAGVDIADVMFNVSGAAARNNAAGAFSAVSDALDVRLNRDQLQEYGVVASNNILRNSIFALAGSKKAIGKKMTWYADCYKKWQPGIEDIYEIGYATGNKVGEWKWKAGITSDEGYTSVGTDSFERSQGLKWIPGRTVKSRPGYVTGQKEKSFVWQAGTPDVSRVGFVADKKEGTFTAAAGFVIKDGKAVWTAGLKHPKYEGVISTKEMFYWIPASTHLWKNPEFDSIEAEKDYQKLSSGARQGANIAAGVAVAAMQ